MRQFVISILLLASKNILRCQPPHNLNMFRDFYYVNKLQTESEKSKLVDQNSWQLESFCRNKCQLGSNIYNAYLKLNNENSQSQQNLEELNKKRQECEKRCERLLKFYDYIRKVR